MLKTALKHLKTILTHKWYVGKYCFKYGLFWQGLVHDLSKFSPTEFLESIKYYTGTSSPIDACKKDKGYSMAWFHHRGRNPHHPEYWVDNFDKGMEPKIKIPWKYMLEMFCDFCGAGIAYGKTGKLDTKRECLWWDTRRKTVVMHPESLRLMDTFMWDLYTDNKITCLKQKKRVYEKEFTSNHAVDWDVFIERLKRL